MSPRLLAGWSVFGACMSPGPRVATWDAQGPPYVSSGPSELLYQSLYRPFGVSIAPSGRHVVVAHLNGLAVYDVATLQAVDHLMPTETEFWGVRWGADGLRIRDRFEGVWHLDLATGQVDVIESSLQGLHGTQPQVLFGWDDIGMPVQKLGRYTVEEGLYHAAVVGHGEDERAVASTADGELWLVAQGVAEPERRVTAGSRYRVLAMDAATGGLYAVTPDGSAQVYPPDWSDPVTLSASLPPVGRVTAAAYSSEHRLAVFVDADGTLIRHDLATDRALHRPGLGRDGLLRAGLLGRHWLYAVTAGGVLWEIDTRGPTYRRIRDRVADAARDPGGDLLVVDVHGWAERHAQGRDGLSVEGAPFACLRQPCTSPSPYPVPPESGITDAWRLAVAEWAASLGGGSKRVRMGYVGGALVVTRVPWAWMAEEGSDWTTQVTVHDPNGAVTSTLELEDPAQIRFGDRELLVGGRRVGLPELDLGAPSTQLVVGGRALAVEVESHTATVSPGSSLGNWDTVRVGQRDAQGAFAPDASWAPAWRAPELRFVRADVMRDRFLLFSQWSDDPSDNAGGVRVWRHRRDGVVRGAAPGVLAAVPPNAERLAFDWPLTGSERAPPRWPPSVGAVPGMLVPSAFFPESDTPLVIVRAQGQFGELDGIVAAAGPWEVHTVGWRHPQERARLLEPAHPDSVDSFVRRVLIVHAGAVVWNGSHADAPGVLAAMREGVRGTYEADSDALSVHLEPHNETYDRMRSIGMKHLRHQRFVDAMMAADIELARELLTELRAEHGASQGGPEGGLFDLLGAPLTHPSLPLLGTGRQVMVRLSDGHLSTQDLGVVDALMRRAEGDPRLTVTQTMSDQSAIHLEGREEPIGRKDAWVSERGVVVLDPSDAWRSVLGRHPLRVVVLEEGVVTWAGTLENVERVLN